MKNNARDVSVVNPENAAEAWQSQRETVSRYHESTPCIVSKNNCNTKKDKGRFLMHVFGWLKDISQDEVIKK